MAITKKKSVPKSAAKVSSKAKPGRKATPAKAAKPAAREKKKAAAKPKAKAPARTKPKSKSPAKSKVSTAAKPKASASTRAKASAPAKLKTAKASPKAAPNGVKTKSNGKSPTHGRSQILGVPVAEDPNLSPFLRKQRSRLLVLRDSMLDSMMETAKDNLRSRAEGSEASAFGMHQADAGSDAYDRDFALNLLSQEQDALYEIDEAIKRIETGSYGVCEMSGKSIPHPRLEAIPFARLTVECQSQIEKQNKLTRSRHAVTSLFGLTDEESGESEEADTSDSKD